MVSESEENEMSCLSREEGEQKIEIANKRIRGQDTGQTIQNYIESLENKSFCETLRFHQNNFLELPEGQRRTRIETITAIVSFFMR